MITRTELWRRRRYTIYGLLVVAADGYRSSCVSSCKFFLTDNSWHILVTDRAWHRFFLCIHRFVLAVLQ
jgi:predicted AlkP superfamily pyrophosphatase or phosphodiesterase